MGNCAGNWFISIWFMCLYNMILYTWYITYTYIYIALWLWFILYITSHQDWIEKLRALEELNSGWPSEWSLPQRHMAARIKPSWQISFICKPAKIRPRLARSGKAGWSCCGVAVSKHRGDFWGSLAKWCSKCLWKMVDFWLNGKYPGNPGFLDFPYPLTSIDQPNISIFS